MRGILCGTCNRVFQEDGEQPSAFDACWKQGRCPYCTSSWWARLRGTPFQQWKDRLVFHRRLSAAGEATHLFVITWDPQFLSLRVCGRSYGDPLREFQVTPP